jgi:hypothetical protein
MSRSVTVVFGNGETHVYQNVPLDITPDQVEERATRDFPGQPVREIMGIDILYRDLRNAIASRTATMEDLDRIAGQYGRRIDDKDRGTFQTWVDYAASNPDAPIPENIFTPPVSRTEAVATGATQGVQNVANFLPRIAAWAADRFGLTPANSAAWVAENMLGYSREEAENIRRNLSRSDIGSFGEVVSAGRQSLRERPNVVAAQAQRPNWFTLGEIGGGIATTAPFLAGLGASAVRLAPSLTPVSPTLSRIVERGGQAVVAGGFSPTATTRGGRLAQRVFGGGTTAAIPAAITAEEPTAGGIATEAAIGAALPIIGTIGRQGAGYAYDFLRGRLGEVRAGEIMRNLIANNADAIIAALRSAPADARTNTAEFLASQGLLTPEIAAATRVVQGTAESAPLEAVARARAAGQEEARAVLRGGETGTEAMQNIDAMRQAVREETEPMLRSVYERADIGRTQIVPAEETARRLRGDVQREIDAATRFANDADWNMSVRQRLDDARSAEEIAANLRAQGLAPLDISGVVGSLRQQAREAAFVSPQREQLLSRFADALENRAAMFGGIIDAAGLHLAKRNIGEFVSSTLGQADPSAIARGTSMLAGQAQKLIDDAFEAAAGPEWGQYNRAFSSGMQRVEQQEFARRLADPKFPEARFERVMAGNDPDYVSNFFGPGNYDINAALSEAQLPVAQRLAREIGASRQAATRTFGDMPPSMRGALPAGATRRFLEMMEPGLSNNIMRSLFRLGGSVPKIGGSGIAAERLEAEIAERTARNAMRALAPGLAEPSEALRLVGVRPTNAMTAGMFNYMGPQTRSFMAQTLQNMVNQPSQIYELPPEMLPPEDQSFMGFQTGPNGEEIPIYAPARVQR